MALKILLTYEGAGRFSTPWEHDLAECMEKLEQGCRVRATITRPRSKKQSNTFFGVIGKAWENQQSVEGVPEFESAEHLRAWLEVQAGHFDCFDFEPEACTRDTIGFVQKISKRKYLFWVNTGTNIRVKWPKTIEEAAVDHDDFQPICRKVFEIIETDICPGVEIADLKAMLGSDT
jgi:hypothetical protein